MGDLIFHLGVSPINGSWIERVGLRIDACWYLDTFTWITVSGSGA